MEAEIRNLEENNFEEFKKVYTTIVQQEFPEYTQKTRDFLTNDKAVKSYFQEPIKLGAFINNSLVGFLVAINPIGGVLFIIWLAVDQTYQKKGIGTKLLEKIEEKALEMGVHNIQLQSDERTIKFYESRGFGKIGLDKKGYFGTDNYIMKKLIQEPKDENFLRSF